MCDLENTKGCDLNKFKYSLFKNGPETRAVIEMLLYWMCRLTVAEYHEQEEIFKLRLGHLKKVSLSINTQYTHSRAH